MNRVCEMTGAEFPLFAFSHCRDVVAAVSKAGGFGVFGATRFSPDQLEAIQPQALRELIVNQLEGDSKQNLRFALLGVGAAFTLFGFKMLFGGKKKK